MKLSMNFEEFLVILPDIFPLLIPLIFLMIALMIMATINLLKKDMPFAQKWIWLLIILLVYIIGPIIYFAVGSKILDDKIQIRNEGA